MCELGLSLNFKMGFCVYARCYHESQWQQLDHDRSLSVAQKARFDTFLFFNDKWTTSHDFGKGNYSRIMELDITQSRKIYQTSSIHTTFLHCVRFIAACESWEERRKFFHSSIYATAWDRFPFFFLLLWHS